jgi:hypothetical protein
MGSGERRAGMVSGIGNVSALPARIATAVARVLWPHDQQRHYQAVSMMSSGSTRGGAHDEQRQYQVSAA